MKKSSFNWFLFIGEILAGALIGAIFAYVGGKIAGYIGGRTLTQGFQDLAGVVLTLIITYPLGVAAGNTLFNTGFHRLPSLRYALMGSATGVGLVLLLAEPLNMNEQTAFLWTAWGILPPVLSALAVRFRARLKANATK